MTREFPVDPKAQEIIKDMQRVARSVGLESGDEFGKPDYFANGGRFTQYDVYDGGRSWSFYCTRAGYKTKEKSLVSDEEYFRRLQHAVRTLGRWPKTSERKRFSLSFGRRRWPTLIAFIEEAIKRGKIKGIEPAPRQEPTEARTGPVQETTPPSGEQEAVAIAPPPAGRPVPPIPAKTGRRKWGRTGIDGFPYEPHDESGVIALFAILYARGVIPWQILALNSGKGVDADCRVDEERREVKVEIKHRLNKTGWNHPIEDLDYVVCWENGWKKFSKPAIELRSLLADLS